MTNNNVFKIVRNFDIDVINLGRYIIAGGVAYNLNFNVRLISREK